MAWGDVLVPLPTFTTASVDWVSASVLTTHAPDLPPAPSVPPVKLLVPSRPFSPAPIITTSMLTAHHGTGTANPKCVP